MVLKVLKNLRVITSSPTYGCNINFRFRFSTGTRKTDQFTVLKEKLLSHTSGFSPAFVKTVKEDVFKFGDRINPENFDSIFMETCIQNNLYELGKCFFYHHYRTSDKVSLAVIRKYFRFCFSFSENCAESDKQFLLSLYTKILADYPALDTISCESLSMGLSITEKWKEGLKLLSMCKEFGRPTGQLYSSIIRAAFTHKDSDLGWNLFDEMTQTLAGITPHPSIYSAALRPFSDNSVVRLFKFLESHDLCIPEENASEIARNKGGSITTVTNRGVCRHCGDRLSPIVISESEFEELTRDFLNPVLIGKDIFIKSKPSELKIFREFLIESFKVDVVLDGLNIAYSGVRKKQSLFASSKLLMDVVGHFLKNEMKVMVLGRNHMKKWGTRDLNFIRKNAHIFFTDDLSSDDPFLLFATMYNGLGTKFVSRDLMRGHKYLLETMAKKRIFSKWQQKHQLILSNTEKTGSIRLTDLSSYLMTAQSNGKGRWHVPIYQPNLPGVQPHIQALRMKWLCVELPDDPT